MSEYMTAAEERKMKAREGAAEHKKEAKDLFNETAKELEGIWKTEKTYIITESQLEQIKQEAKREGRADADTENEISYDVGYEKGRADAIDALFEKIYDVDMDSSLIYLRFDKDKFNVPFMTRKCELKELFKEQLKSRISTVKGV